MEDEDHLKEIRRLTDAGVRVLEGRAGDPEFDGEFGGPEKWDADVREQRGKALGALAALALGLFLLAYDQEGWRFWLVLLFTGGSALALLWRLLEWRVAAGNRRRWRAERGLP